MSVLLKKVLWFRVSDINSGINITDSIDMNFNRGMDIRNNVLQLNLKNPTDSLNSDGTHKHKYINEEGKIMFEEQDILKVYLRYTDDMANVEDSAWGNNTETPTDTYLKGIYYLIEFNVQQTIKGTPIKVKCADKTYVLFNRLLAKTFLPTESLNAPELIQQVVRLSCQNPDGVYNGTGNEANVKFDIDAKLEDAEGGFIQDTRKATYEDGTVNSDTTFPDIAMSKVWKPVYEWIQEISQIENLNTTAELEGSGGKKLVYGRPFLYYVDESNKFHWFETNNAVSSTITIGTTKGIYSYKLDKKVFDAINFIIYRGGEDFYGNGTLNYFYDETTDVKNLKMRVVGMTDIARDLIQKEIDGTHSAGSITEDNATPGTFTFGEKRYTVTYPITAIWNNTSYANDGEYNDALRTEILRLCENRARSLAAGLGNARYKGSIERKGTIETVGALLNITNIHTGQGSELLRVMTVRDQINRKGWFTTLEIEQDQKAIIGGAVS